MLKTLLHKSLARMQEMKSRYLLWTLVLVAITLSASLSAVPVLAVKNRIEITVKKAAYLPVYIRISNGAAARNYWTDYDGVLDEKLSIDVFPGDEFFIPGQRYIVEIDVDDNQDTTVWTICGSFKLSPQYSATVSVLYP